MQFVDEAEITVRSGNGGDGCVSFRREKFEPKGGPDGGDGGKGGDVYLEASGKLMTLYDFRLKQNFQAQNGQPGGGKNKHGRSGRDLVINVPTGTIVYEITRDRAGKVISDLSDPGQRILIARGGRGGKGNTHFKSSTRRTPRFAQPGGKGEEKRLFLELKLLADLGLIGMPNAGKSTFISAVSAAKPKIAAYPFTTLTPQLGVYWDEEGNQLVIADIPGLIEGAHQGQGLGDKFLKHVARTGLLIHILSLEEISLDDPWAGFELINKELGHYSPNLLAKEQLQVINKIDLWPQDKVDQLRQKALRDEREIFFISLLTAQGLNELMAEAAQRVRRSRNATN